MHQILMRRMAAILLLLVGIGFLGVTTPTVMRALDEDRQAMALRENPWRRTARGWEKATSWNAPAPPAQLHPLVLALWMLTSAVGSLYCCSPDATKRP